MRFVLTLFAATLMSATSYAQLSDMGFYVEGGGGLNFSSKGDDYKRTTVGSGTNLTYTNVATFEEPIELESGMKGYLAAGASTESGLYFGGEFSFSKVDTTNDKVKYSTVYTDSDNDTSKSSGTYAVDAEVGMNVLQAKAGYEMPLSDSLNAFAEAGLGIAFGSYKQADFSADASALAGSGRVGLAMQFSDTLQGRCGLGFLRTGTFEYENSAKTVNIKTYYQTLDATCGLRLSF